jgi:undecaprenyl-diphosphatase
MIEFLTHWDTQLFIFLNGIHSPFWDTIMWWISGTKSWIPLYLVIIAVIIYQKRKKAILVLLFIALLIFLSDQLSVHLFKNVVQRLRPCHAADLQDIVPLVKNKCGGKFGFVSSHASNTFAIATFLVLLFKNRIFGVFIFIWAAIVSYSRIYLGVHFPLDIICGGLFGFILGFFVFKAYFFTEKKVFKQS